MLQQYFSGTISLLEARARCLRAKIPRDLPRDYDLLAQDCANEVDRLVTQLRELRDNPIYQTDTNQPERIRRLKRTVSDLDFLESIGIAALDHVTDEDHFLTRLVDRIRREINYPLQSPAVTTLSQQYFWSGSELNLLGVPLVQARFLLHLPDIYHELAHRLVTIQNDPIVEPFQNAMSKAALYLWEYIAKEQAKEDRRHGPRNWAYLLQIWRTGWLKYWMCEFFCDLFSVYTLGPAFVWAHFHLSAKRGGHPFEVPMLTLQEHPADDARMNSMFNALSNTGFTKQAGDIQGKWAELLRCSQVEAEPEFHRCYPNELLKRIAEYAYEGVSGTGCRIATPDTSEPIHNLLNEAWNRFWSDPEGYTAWEAEAVNVLKKENAIEIV